MKSIVPQQIGRRTRYKASKSESVIKPGRQDGKLVIYQRKCAYGECDDCGIKKYFSGYKCPLEWDDEFMMEIKEYQDVDRPNSDKKQKELVVTKITGLKLMTKIERDGGAVIKHIWQSHWGSHQRRYDYNTFTSGMVRYKCDFSATLDINPQDKLNSAISAHAIQNVAIYSLMPNTREYKNSAGILIRKRFIHNIGFNYWASGNYTLSNNYYFHYVCLKWTIKYLIAKFGADAVRRLVGYTDGCPDQYKSRRNAIMVARVCDELGLDEYLHYFAPTASFKTNVDAFGGDTKTFIAKGERRENFRCKTAEDVYLECKNNMPQPRKVSDENRELENCDERIQVYLVDIKDATEDHLNDPFVIVTDSINDSWDSTELRGIKSVYALRGYKGGTDGTFYFI